MEIIKWPRTPHLPWSGGATQDDITIEVGDLYSGPYAVTEKLDGECTTMTREFVHARSGDSADHPSRHEVKRLWGEIGWRIPDGWYLVGENVYAKHSIYYPDVEPPYFYLFAVHRGGDVLSWDETETVAELLGLRTVPLMAYTRDRGQLLNFDATWKMIKSSEFGPECEGYVARPIGRFPLSEWETAAAKYVRPNHVMTDEHWMSAPIVRNGVIR